MRSNKPFIEGPFTLKLEIKVERVQDLFRCCFNSPYNWIAGVSSERHDSPGMPWLKGNFGYKIQDWYTGKEYRLGRGSIDMALPIFAAKHLYQFGQWVNEQDDCITGNLFVQLCCFGEELYC